MLSPMDLPELVLGVVVGVGLVLLVGLITAALLRRRPATEPPGEAAGFRDDDLPGFLESPPGAATSDPRTGWATLAPVDASPPPAPAPRGRRDTLVVAAAMAGTALLLGTAAAVAAVSGSDHRSRPAASDAASAEARLTFGGVVLEPRAVGVTATYPVVELSSDGERARAKISFPTFNCLAGEAPPDPVAAGCAPAPTEYAELDSPDLTVGDDGDGLVVSGRFATETRPNGSAPVPTGRVYELRITVAPAGPRAADGWRPADGVLELGPGRASTVDEPGVSVLRSGS